MQTTSDEAISTVVFTRAFILNPPPRMLGVVLSVVLLVCMTEEGASGEEGASDLLLVPGSTPRVPTGGFVRQPWIRTQCST